MRPRREGAVLAERVLCSAGKQSLGEPVGDRDGPGNMTAGSRFLIWVGSEPTFHFLPWGVQFCLFALR